MSVKMLVLHPHNPFSVYGDAISFEKELKKTGFIGGIRNENVENYYEGGQCFFDCITFADSHKTIVIDAPNVSIEDARIVDRKSMCYIHFPKTSVEPEYIGAAGLEPPRCPFCNQGNKNPYDLLSLWYENKNGFAWTCSNCKKVSVYMN